jgi:tetratricopeptide (TPR) repeat protein
VIKLNPNDANTYINRGKAYCSKGDYICARADFEQGLRFDPNHADARQRLNDLRREDGK